MALRDNVQHQLMLLSFDAAWFAFISLSLVVRLPLLLLLLLPRQRGPSVRFADRLTTRDEMSCVKSQSSHHRTANSERHR